MNPTHNELYLADDALDAFDKDFRDWQKYSKTIGSAIATKSVKKILDVGGGNGRFVDKLLKLYPKAQACVLDYADTMLEKNRLDARKTTQQGTATQLDTLFIGQKFDLITINMLLHHLVGDNEPTTRNNVLASLVCARKILAPEGRVVVYEQVYNGSILSIEPGKIIYRLTQIRAPWISRLLKKFGANTAGVGVRFRSVQEWQDLFDEAGYALESHSWILPDQPSLLRRTVLNIKQVGSYVFVLK